MDGRKVLGRRIREIRESRKMSLLDLARSSGVSYSYLKYIETSGRQPSGVIVHKIADALQVDIREITARARSTAGAR